MEDLSATTSAFSSESTGGKVPNTNPDPSLPSSYFATASLVVFSSRLEEQPNNNKAFEQHEYGRDSTNWRGSAVAKCSQADDCQQPSDIFMLHNYAFAMIDAGQLNP